MGVTYSYGKDDQFQDSDSKDKLESLGSWKESGKEQVAQPSWVPETVTGQEWPSQDAQELLCLIGRLVFWGRKGSVLCGVNTAFSYACEIESLENMLLQGLGTLTQELAHS